MADSQTRRALDPSEELMVEKMLRPWTRKKRLREPPMATLPHRDYAGRLMSPRVMADVPRLLVCHTSCHTTMNKVRAPVNALGWARDGRRAITGNQSGEFTLWNGLGFNFEGLIAAHTQPVRSLAWSRSGTTLLSGDAKGCIKYWESTMTPVNEKEDTHGGQAIRGLKFAPSDAKFASAADDGTVRIWDWELFQEERVLAGHGWDVKALDWHPSYKLLASGSKDNQVKLWDPRQRSCLATLYGHKHTVTAVSFCPREFNWLLTASRDSSLKLYDLRVFRDAETYRGHNREVVSCCWHPVSERIFASGAFDGTVNHWLVGCEDPLHSHKAHDQAVWAVEWHPVGHVLATASNDHRVRFWCRPRPGDDLQLQPAQRAAVEKRAQEKGYDLSAFFGDTMGGANQQQQQHDKKKDDPPRAAAAAAESRGPPPPAKNTLTGAPGGTGGTDKITPHHQAAAERQSNHAPDDDDLNLPPQKARPPPDQPRDRPSRFGRGPESGPPAGGGFNESPPSRQRFGTQRSMMALTLPPQAHAPLPPDDRTNDTYRPPPTY